MQSLPKFALLMFMWLRVGGVACMSLTSRSEAQQYDKVASLPKALRTQRRKARRRKRKVGFKNSAIRPWWSEHWMVYLTDAWHLSDGSSEQDPRFFMDQELWEHWQAKCTLKGRIGYKQMVEHVLLSSLEKHRWRVQDPLQADIVVIPALLSASSIDLCGDHKENQRDLAVYLKASKRWVHGEDHVMPAMYFGVQYTMTREMQPYVRNMTALIHNYEQTLHWQFDGESDQHFGYRRAQYVPYLSSFDGRKMKQVSFDDWTNRRYSLHFVGQTEANNGREFERYGFYYHGYDLRKDAMNGLGHVFPDALLVSTDGQESKANWPSCDKDHKPAGCVVDGGLSDYVETLAQARFGLMFRGDTSGSARLYDFIDASAIPIIVDDAFMRDAAPFRDIVDWSRIAIFIPEHEYRSDPAGSIVSAINLSEDDIRQYVERVQKAQKCISWQYEDSHVPDFILAEVASTSAASASVRRSLRHSAFCEL